MRGEQRIKTLIISLISFILIITVFEILFRVSGKEPWTLIFIGSPKAFQADPIIGWKNKPGTYYFPEHTPGKEQAIMTIDKEGYRIASPQPRKGDKTVIYTGGSDIMGWAVSDNEVFTWKISERFKDLRIVNMASAGYSTYQSLLNLRDYFNNHEEKPDLVISAFDFFQIERNVAAPQFFNGLARFNGENRLGLPYCTLSLKPGKDLEYFPPAIHPNWPLKKYLALINEAEFLYVRIKYKEAYSQQYEVTELLLKELANLCKLNDVPFLISIMIIPEPFWDLKVPDNIGEKYMRFMETNQIDYVDCCVDYFKTGDIIPGDLHPNEKVHERWAECVGNAIEERLYQ